MADKVYYVCKYTPLEMLESYGLEVERLDPELSAPACGAPLAHPNLCGYGEAILNAVSSGKVRRLFLVDCCDVCRRVYDILESQGELDFLYLMDLPHKRGPREERQMEKEMLRLNAKLAELTGWRFDEAAVRAAWDRGIREVRASRPAAPYLLLTGAHGSGSLRERIEGVTGLPVLDDTCSGNRELRPVAGGEFFRDYGAALLGQPSPCMRMQFERAEEPTAVGTICHTIKFCDYYGFQYRRLREKDEPLLKIETDFTSQSEGQIETRLEAFAEVIQPEVRSREGHAGGRYVCGIDSGSSSTNAVILDEARRIVGYSVLPTGGGVAASGRKALAQALEASGLGEKDLARVITTGYGRNNLQMSDSSITEITCHARGARYLYPEARTVIDIGGQDSKVIALDDAGQVTNFVMNDKCAAGTGRFLETMARTLDLSMDEMGSLGLDSHKPVTISSTCTVFAESEVVSLIASNTEPSDIVNGLNQSVAARTVGLVRRCKGRAPFIMTGGVARNAGVVRALEEALGEAVYVPPEAQICGALGAALFALE